MCSEETSLLLTHTCIICSIFNRTLKPKQWENTLKDINITLQSNQHKTWRIGTQKVQAECKCKNPASKENVGRCNELDPAYCRLSLADTQNITKSGVILLSKIVKDKTAWFQFLPGNTTYKIRLWVHWRRFSKDDSNDGLKINLKMERKQSDWIGGRLTALSLWICRWKENKWQYF